MPLDPPGGISHYFTNVALDMEVWELSGGAVAPATRLRIMVKDGWTELQLAGNTAVSHAVKYLPTVKTSF